MLKVNEIFFDIQGESTFIGFPTVFVSLSGGTPGARYTTIDQKHALKTEKEMTVESIVEEIGKYNCYIVVITGGEPLNQDKTNFLISELVNNNYLVLLETYGSKPIKSLNSKAIVLLEIQCPDNPDFGNFLAENINYLRTKDQVKFIISSSRDYHYAKELIFKEMLFEKCNILFFANTNKLPLKTLSDWIISDQLPVRLGFRINKLFFTKKATN